jgi:3-deoxy-manno-octulosonate cytidylyltransferase (CMP-KDO synthetase)
MLQHVYERVACARQINRVVVATDDARIRAEALRFGAAVVMTSPEHSTGTERVAEAAAREPADYVVNVQGDEPLIDPEAIDQAVRPVFEAGCPPMVTLKKRITELRDLEDPNVVKVVTDHRGNAIYFSRSVIPFPRDGRPAAHFKHLGLYVYQRDFLLGYPQLPSGPLEAAEKLEQLRALENGYAIRVVETSYESIGVDIPEDLDRVRRLLSEQNAGDSAPSMFSAVRSSKESHG